MKIPIMHSDGFHNCTPGINSAIKGRPYIDTENPTVVINGEKIPMELLMSNYLNLLDHKIQKSISNISKMFGVDSGEDSDV